MYPDGFRVDVENGVIYGPSGKSVGAPQSTGYLVFNVGVPLNKSKCVHVAIWEYVHGPKPNGMNIDHIDGNKKNNRIDNLELVTPRENALRAYRLGLKPRMRFGERCHLSKLTVETVEKIKYMLRVGLSCCEIGRRLGVHRKAVNDIKVGKTWKQVFDSDDDRIASLCEGVVDPAIPRVHYNSIKTHCKHGHEFTDQNTTFFARGGRGCRECQRTRRQKDKTRANQ